MDRSVIAVQSAVPLGVIDRCFVLQVLALFVALPPVVSVIQLYPKFAKWLKSLTWLRKLLQPWWVRRPKKAKARTLSISGAEAAGWSNEKGDERVYVLGAPPSVASQEDPTVILGGAYVVEPSSFSVNEVNEVDISQQICDDTPAHFFGGESAPCRFGLELQVN